VRFAARPSCRTEGIAYPSDCRAPSVTSIFILLMYLILREFSADEMAQARSFVKQRIVTVEHEQKM
jgi:hypothetical protein